ncbi:MAG: AraC family transcriptional regulator [Methylobacteriaceae bacterium]|jgi:bifunctional N-acetylglucosamine-1-phosphate-uridyltransferase/glucosamine-1-phosphate-acetyltransferase GlmU-like protein|nr:AraC family transcriptional regulator [Methylobacteriaceae bacterium]
MREPFIEEMDDAVFDYMNYQREQHGYMTIQEICELIENGNTIYDPFSVLISRRCKIGTNNYFFPSVSVFCAEEGDITIGNANIFYTNTLITAVNGPISIGSGNQFGEGGFVAKANRPGANITIGDNGRYLGGSSVYGESILGSGSQLLGPVSADSCHLEAGGSWRDSDPHERAGLLKGIGKAQDLLVPKGHVIISRDGNFSIGDMFSQADIR